MSNTECSICYEKFTYPVITPCKHIFCLKCLAKWLISKLKHVYDYDLEAESVKFTCPYDTLPLNPVSYVELYYVLKCGYHKKNQKIKKPKKMTDIFIKMFMRCKIENEI